MTGVALLEHDGRRHRGEAALAGRDRAGAAGPRVVPVHRAVQHEAETGRDHAGGHAEVWVNETTMPSRIDAGDGGGVLAVAADRGKRSLLAAADAGGAFVGIGIRQQPLQRRRGEIRIADDAIPCRGRRSSSPRRRWGCTRRVVAERGQVEAFEDAQHLGHRCRRREVGAWRWAAAVADLQRRLSLQAGSSPGRRA